MKVYPSLREILRGILRDLLLVSGILTCASVAWLAWTLTQELRPLLTDTRRVVLSIGGTAAELRKATGEWKDASKAQAKSATESLQKTKESLDKLIVLESQLTQLVENTDQAINGALVPAITRSVLNTSADIGKVSAASAKAIQQTAADVKPLVENATLAVQDMRKVLGDPNVPLALTNIAETSKHLETISRDGITIADNGVQVSTDLKDAVHRATRPGSFAVRIGGLVLSEGAKLWSWWRGLFK
jgi:hypothetical protein